MNILLGLTGSVASTLAPKLVEALRAEGTVEVIATRSARHFFQEEGLDVPVWTDADEWKTTKFVPNQSILHIELRRRADILVIAPCTAETLSALAAGRAHTLLTMVARAWDLRKPLVIAPAMNTFMWEHPATAEHLATIQRWYGERFTLVPPVAKRLACGDEGIGALAPLPSIIQAVKDALS